MDRLLSRYRRTTALVGTVLILGVVTLNAHEALPEHHHRHGETTICIAALSIAVLAAMGWRTKRSVGLNTRLGVTVVRRVDRRLAVERPSVLARAGPPGPAVLRL
jgi:hypothetical protein